jgi:hypothetical protein
VTEHLTSTEIEQYVGASLPALDLLRADDHLAACDACRLLAVGSSDAPRRLVSVVSAIRRDLALSPEQEATLSRVSRFPNRTLMTNRLGRWGTLAALAATAAIVANIIWGTLKPGTPRPATAVAAVTVPQATPADPLTPSERRLVDETVARGDFSRPRVLDALRTPTSALMGTRTALASFAAVRPQAVVVDTERPTFEWTGAERGAEYRVSVYDEAFGPVAASDWLRETQWTMVRPLPRGKAYTWQVTARVGGRDTTVPAPPQPEARFRVTSVEQNTQLAELRKRAGDSHVALAVLLADAGVLDEAERELTRASAANPGSSAVKRLQESLRTLRPDPQ